MAIIVLIPVITNEITHMGKLVQTLVSESDLENQIEAYLPENIAEQIENIIVSKDFQNLFEADEIGDITNFAAQKILPTISNIFSETLNIILGILSLAIVILYLIFLLIDYNDVVAEWKTLIPPKYKNNASESTRNGPETFQRITRTARMLFPNLIKILPKGPCKIPGNL